MRDETFYTPEEIAQKLKLSKYTIYEMIKRGEISAHRIGRSLRVTATELETYLQQSRKTDNTFDAVIVEKDEETMVKILDTPDTEEDLYFCINTDLEGPVRVSIKPEEIILSLEPIVCSARNVLPGVVTRMEELPNNYKITVNVGVPLTVTITKRSVAEMNFNIGDKIYAVFKSMSVVVV